MSIQEKKKPMRFKISKTSDAKNSQFKALLFGGSGSGKTTSIKGFGDQHGLPRDSTLLVVTDRNPKVLNNEDFPMIKVESWREFEGLKEALVGGVIYGIDLSAIKTIVVDSLTALSDFLVEEIIGHDRVNLSLERSGSRKPKGIYEDSLTQEDYGLYKSRISKVVREMTSLPYNVIVMSLEKKRKDNEGFDVNVPCIPGSFALEIGRAFDYIFHIEIASRTKKNDAGEPVKNDKGSVVVEKKTMWRTGGSEDSICKDATGCLPKLITTDWKLILDNYYEERIQKKQKETSEGANKK